MARTNANLNINRIYQHQVNQLLNNINNDINRYYIINNRVENQEQEEDVEMDNLIIDAQVQQRLGLSHVRLNRRVTSLAEMRCAMRVDFEFFIEYEDFYNIARGQGYNRQQADAARFQYLCAVGNIEELDKWITDYIRDHGENEFYFMANRPIRIPQLQYSLYPIVTAIMWNDNPELIRYLSSYGLEINITDERGHYPEEAALDLPYFNPVAHLFPNTPALFQENLNVVINNNNNIDFEPQQFIRDAADFQDVIREVQFITGERNPPVGWEPVPIRNGDRDGQAHQT